MKHYLLRIWHTGLVGNFLAGLFVILPVAVTLIILNWVIDKFMAVIGPGSRIGELLVSGGGSILGPDHSILAYFLSAVLAIFSVWLLGLLVKTRAKQRILHSIDQLFGQVPVIRTIYKPVAQVIRLFASDDAHDIKAMQVVTCSFGDGATVLALLTTSDIYQINGQRQKLVYLPTSPLPMSGGLVFVPENKVTRVNDISVDDLMKIYLSLGALAPDLAGKKFHAAPMS